MLRLDESTKLEAWGENFYPFLAKCSLLLHDAILFVIIGVIDIMTSHVSKKDHAVEGSVGKTVAQPGFIQDDKLLSKFQFEEVLSPYICWS